GGWGGWGRLGRLLAAQGLVELPRKKPGAALEVAEAGPVLLGQYVLRRAEPSTMFTAAENAARRVCEVSP
ncbi:MAG TPA: hypothetical protein VN945_14530, partial [Gemmatimonadales bacterium]|nr:hypothetical protein [Gemmatimonadales bacterium]